MAKSPNISTLKISREFSCLKGTTYSHGKINGTSQAQKNLELKNNIDFSLHVLTSI